LTVAHDLHELSFDENLKWLRSSLNSKFHLASDAPWKLTIKVILVATEFIGSTAHPTNIVMVVIIYD
jgi:hypothetical protein